MTSTTRRHHTRRARTARGARARLAGQEGFTMALVMGLLIFASLLGLAAYASAGGEHKQSAESRDRKQAYAAAEAGLNWYLSKLNLDPNYWTKCSYTATNGVPQFVNARWNGTGADPRKFTTLNGTTAEWALEVLPASGSCSQSTMIDALGAFRIRATGRVNGTYRSVVARFAKSRFLDFLWYTKYETTDPLNYATASQDDAADNCERYRAARETRTFNCLEIQFGQGDKVLGPLHSSDSLLVCPTVTFGSAAADKVESEQTPAYKLSDGCSGTPTVTGGGSIKPGVKPIELPPTNEELEETAGVVFSGDTSIVLNGANMTVTTGSPATTTTMAIPANGLVYVKKDTSRGCDTLQPPLMQTYGVGTGSESKGCANVYVRGTYSKDLTIASAKDVVVAGNLTYTSDAMLGLIAENFVRVFHPTTTHSSAGNRQCSYGDNASATVGGTSLSSTSDIVIQAAVMSLKHGFTVDNYNCGDDLGKLNLTGAISQKFRGAVALGGATGYVKNYVYDTRMKYRSPPLFLDPVESAWTIQRMNEQSPATKPAT